MSSPTHTLFGYGSLIDRESRRRTVPESIEAIPVIASGVARGWWKPGSPVGYSTTFVAARLAADATCTGVLYSVDTDGLAQTDQREIGYRRVLLDPTAITRLDGETAPLPSPIWFYALDESSHRPNAQYPIVQSYVDLCVGGSLELEGAFPAAKAYGFAQAFIETTQDWNAYWVNDRIHPRRPFVHVPRAMTIDALLHEAVPALFNRIQIEPAHWDTG